LASCSSTGFDPGTGLYADPIGGAPATQNDTVYSPSLRCLAARASGQGLVAPRLAVGEIADLTGRNDLQTGRMVSQGAALFAVTALTKAGVPTVERLDRAVSEVERQYAQVHLLSDTPEAAGQSGENFRPVFAGEIAGSRYYVIGGVTELNYNLRSRGADLAIGAAESAGAAGRMTGSDYVMNVAVDLRLVDTISQEVVATASYQKQIVGHELRVGVFDFLGGNVFDLSGGGSALEPAQFAVRTAVERGLYDFVADLYGLPRDTCLEEAGGNGPSLLARRAVRTPDTANTAAATGGSRVAPAGVSQVPAPVPPVPPRSDAPARRGSGATIDPATWTLRSAPGPR
jgi:curli production assembly/transport component CsgG/holdfast attachment protein HfaB